MQFSGIRKYGFDTETTGVNVKESRIVTAAIVAHGGGMPDAKMTWLINPGIEIPKEATEIHGITTEHVRANGRDAKTSLNEIAQNLTGALRNRLPIVAFNLAFDWSILDAELQRYSLPTMAERYTKPINTLVDPYVIDKAVDKYRKGTRKLQPTAELYNVKLDDWHTADADALAAVLIANALFDKYEYLNRLSPERLFAAQQRWRKEQCESLQAYFRNPGKSGEKYDPNARIDGGWPILNGE